ncbi:hypothetical protein NHX12_014861 [Muraenolepis orangiensis]|uniref:Uncharacterized protein n=1 Tax=Muraenolepis orangiensis TaxID=630683 RepID=A0A9Q0I5I0_9TELE|nr:hypothetical protein NHX12_014861 [Muraenolepis orangiensis]
MFDPIRWFPLSSTVTRCRELGTSPRYLGRRARRVLRPHSGHRSPPTGPGPPPASRPVVRTPTAVQGVKPSCGSGVQGPDPRA